MVTRNTQQQPCQPQPGAQLIDATGLLRKTPLYDVRLSGTSRVTCAGVRTDAGLAGGRLSRKIGLPFGSMKRNMV
jgi:hypothetical protein